jgi:GNAT superfamily N-acetyltransferase
MKIDYREEIPSAPAFAALFDTTGWNKTFHLSADELKDSLQHSWYAVSAYDGDHLVGFGRVLSDGVLYAVLCDLIVVPSHQTRGIGSEILARLVEQCTSAGIRTIQLFSAAGKTAFYGQRGFEARPADAPGMRLARKQD